MPATNPESQAPKKQAPMKAASSGDVVTSQPAAEPQPEPKMSLRGGGMNVGFTCCGGHCSFHKHCC